MKKICVYILFMGLLPVESHAVDHIEVYRRKYNCLQFGVIGACTGGFAYLFGAGVLNTAHSVFYGRGVTKDALIAPVVLSIPLGGLGVVLTYMHASNLRIQSPKVVFDREGCTYEEFGFFENLRTHRFEWDEVTEQWDEITYDQSGWFVHKVEWYYRIRNADGTDSVVVMDVQQLDIPEHRVAEIEAARRGKL